MTKLLDISYIALTIAFTVYGQLILKWRINSISVSLPKGGTEKILYLISLLFDPYIFSGIVAAFFASLAWMAAMTRFDLSNAYPFMALNFVFVVLLAALLFGETLSTLKLFGIFLICLGTVVLARG
jgi:drug/metabolite transporter (DMT)-like permease